MSVHHELDLECSEFALRILAALSSVWQSDSRVISLALCWRLDAKKKGWGRLGIVHEARDGALKAFLSIASVPPVDSLARAEA
jgi:hypothetical protein